MSIIAVLAVAMNDTIDLYVQVTRASTKSIVRRYLSNVTANRIKWGENFIDAMIRDGWSEGVSLGLPGSAPNNRSMVPYGCWFRSFSEKNENNGIYLNVGPNPLFDLKQNLLRLSSYNDKYFCTEAIKKGYSSIIAIPNGDYNRWDIEIIICHSSCITETINNTCPHQIGLRLNGYKSSSMCNCSDDDDWLNCKNNKNYNNNDNNNNIDEHGKYSDIRSNDNPKLCIMNNFDLPSRINNAGTSKWDIYVNMTFILTYRLLFKGHNNITTIIDNILETSGDKHSLLVVDLESPASAYMKNPSSFDNQLKILNYKTKLTLVPVFTNFDRISTLNDYNTKIFSNLGTFNNQEVIAFLNFSIGIIYHRSSSSSSSSMDKTVLSNITGFDFIINQTKCLRKLGSSIIILLSYQSYDQSKRLMSILHPYIDLIFSVGTHADVQFSCSRSSGYNNDSLCDSSSYFNRILHINNSSAVGVFNYYKPSTAYHEEDQEVVLKSIIY